ncbi:MAG: DinB family protein [Acidobacteriota bacterium]|nr:DinB family protein [Acidobacteriota bacterium]
MRSDTFALVDYLARNRAAVRDAVDGVPRPLRERRPAADRWSTAEVLEHLAMVETAVHGLLAAALEAGRAEAAVRGEPRAPFVIDEGHVARLLDRRQRITASAAGQPRGGLDADAAWGALQRIRGQVLELVSASDALALETATGRHPLLGPLNFRQWVVFLGGHDARHAAQIAETGRALGPPAR